MWFILVSVRTCQSLMGWGELNGVQGEAPRMAVPMCEGGSQSSLEGPHGDRLTYALKVKSLRHWLDAASEAWRLYDSKHAGVSERVTSSLLKVARCTDTLAVSCAAKAWYFDNGHSGDMLITALDALVFCPERDNYYKPPEWWPWILHGGRLELPASWLRGNCGVFLGAWPDWRIIYGPLSGQRRDLRPYLRGIR